MGNKYSIYENPEIEKKLMAIYENRMAQWPVPYESRYINSQYGKIFAIISGPEDGPPILNQFRRVRLAGLLEMLLKSIKPLLNGSI